MLDPMAEWTSISCHYPCNSISACKLWLQAKVEGKKNSTSLFKRLTVHVKSLGTYVFAVTSTNCPGRKWAAYKGVPSKEEERSCSTRCWNP